MGLTIDLVPELENKVRTVARQEGISPGQYVEKLLRERLFYHASTSPVSEVTLLKQINLGISPTAWQRYHELRTKLESKTLASIEQQEFAQITDQLEEANVSRIEALIKLASLRNTTLDALMDEFGLRTSAYVL